jgi:hypothetical protein
LLYCLRYSLIQQDQINNPEAVPLRYLDVMHYRGRLYDVTQVDASADSHEWSYAEHVAYAAKPVSPPERMDKCREITVLFSGISPTDHAWRCEGVCYSTTPEVLRATTCLERLCWDATFATSAGEHPLLRIVSTDAEGNSVVVATALLRRQTEECLRIFWRTHITLTYGRALRMHMTSMSDGDPKLAKTAQEAAVLQERGRHGTAVTICAFHAVFKTYRDDYGRSHGRFDGGIGETLLAMLRVMLQTAETQAESKVHDASTSIHL